MATKPKSRRRRLLRAISVSVVLLLLANYLFRDIPQPAKSAMLQAESFELISLHPNRIRNAPTTLQTTGPATRETDGSTPAAFHRYRVLGRAAVTDPTIRRQLFDALQSGIRWDIAIPSMCFNPRHGIHMVSGGRTIDLLICFECSQGQMYVDDGRAISFIVGRSPEATFNQIWQQSGLTVAPQHVVDDEESEFVGAQAATNPAAGDSQTSPAR